MKKTAWFLSVGLLVAAAMSPGKASSHREAPLIALDPAADNTDVYAFVDPNDRDMVTLIANYIPFQSPDGGPNFYLFDPNVLYEIHVDNNGDAVEDVTFQWRFTTERRNPQTFLYNTGPVTTIDDADLNVRQFYSLTRVDGPRRTGTPRLLSGRLPVPPPNIGPRSTPNYGLLAGGVQQVPPVGMRVFAGQRDEGFFVDLGIFDLLGVGTGQVEDSTAGYNVSTLAIQVPMAQLTRSGSRPSGPADPNAVIGVWATASRQAMATRAPGQITYSGDYIQVSRLGMPLVNEAVIDLARKDVFNAIEPTSDAAALDRVLDPEVPKLLTLLFGVRTPPTPRQDLGDDLPDRHPRPEPAAERAAVRDAAPQHGHPAGRGRRRGLRPPRRAEGRRRRLPERPARRRRRAGHRAPGRRRGDAADAGLQHGAEQRDRRRRRRQRRPLPARLPLPGRPPCGQPVMPTRLRSPP